MSQVLKNYIEQFKFISKIRDEKLRKGILKQFGNDDKFFCALEEVVENTLKNNVPLPGKEKKRLKKYKRVLFQFLKPVKNKRKKKQLISQSGRFLPILIPLIVSLLSQTK